MGHTIGGVRGTYDRYEYLDEKRDALSKFALLLQEIVNQPGSSELFVAGAPASQRAAA